MATVASSSPWAICLCKWNDDPSEPVSTLCGESMFSTAGMGLNNMVDFFRLYSHGNLDLSGSQVFGWFELPQKKSQYTGSGPNPAGRTQLVNWCLDAVTAAGVNVNQFYGAVLFLNNPTDLFAEHYGAPGRVVCDPNNSSLSAVAQEMLHGYGLFHARQDGSTGEYLDRYDVMSVYNADMAKGDPNFPACTNLSANKQMGPGLNAALMDSKGWLDPDRIWMYGGKSGSFSLRPHHRLDLPGFLVARVGPYYVEFRMNEGFDAGIYEPVVLVHRFDPDGHSYLMNGTNGYHFLAAGNTFSWGTGPSAVIVRVDAIDSANRIASLSVIVPEYYVAVPDLVGDSLAQAQQTAQAAGFGLHTDGKGNVVADQDPAAGDKVPAGATIYITLTYEGKG